MAVRGAHAPSCLVHHEARAEETRALLDGHHVLKSARLVDRSEDQLVHVVAHLWRAPRRGESLGRGARRRAADASQCVAACVARRTFMTRVLNECESDLAEIRKLPGTREICRDPVSWQPSPCMSWPSVLLLMPGSASRRPPPVSPPACAHASRASGCVPDGAGAHCRGGGGEEERRGEGRGGEERTLFRKDYLNHKAASYNT